jgi:hypothetical protein
MLRMAREIDDQFQIFEALFHLSTVYLTLGDLGKARDHCSESLRVVGDLGSRIFYPRLLDNLVEIERREGRLLRSVRLRFIAAFLRDPDADFDLSSFKDLGLPKDAARAEWSAAKSMTTDQAVADALSDQE